MDGRLDIEDIEDDWKKATDGLANWRSEATEDYDFAASRQWEPDYLDKLDEEDRPGVTFDRIGVFLDAITGMEMNNRQAITYFPVEEGDIRVNDTLTQAAKFYENDCGAEDEDSEAARDAVICGIGVTETVMSYDKNPDGAPAVVRKDPLFYWWDPSSTRRNLADRRFDFVGEWMDKEEAENRWPDAVFSGEDPSNSTTQPHHADLAQFYQENVTGDKPEGKVFILHYQCWKKEPVYKVKDPMTGQVVDLTESKWRSAGRELLKTTLERDPVEKRDYVKTTRKRFYRAFVSGHEILEQNELPVQHFTRNVITFKRDRNNNSWFGAVRSMKDPQRWANKWLSQMMYIVSTNAKGGAFAEVGAFQDPRKAEELWAQPNPIILLKEGGIKKIQERSQAQYPSGMDRLMQFAFNALPMVSGINLEVLGLADREQAGIVETQRKQSAYTILGPFFAAIREYRRARGLLLLEFLKLIPQETLVRIVGPRGQQWIPLAFDRNARYDVKIDQAPDSPDFKQKVWEGISQIVPAMLKAGYPIPPELLNFSPLPPDIAERWVEWIKTQGWMPPEHRQQMEQMQQQMQQISQQNSQLKEENASMRIDHGVELLKLQAKATDADSKSMVKVYQTQMEAASREMEVASNEQLNRVELAMKGIMEAKSLDIQKIDSLTNNLNAMTKYLQTQQKEISDIGQKVSKKKSDARVRRVQDGVYQIEFPE